jgi:hypothetical protein
MVLSNLFCHKSDHKYWNLVVSPDHYVLGGIMIAIALVTPLPMYVKKKRYC